MPRSTVVRLFALALLLAACTNPATPTATPGATPSATEVAVATAVATPTLTTSAAVTPAQPSPSDPPSAATFTISSPAFANGSAIPSKFSCGGAGISPGIAWSGAPDGTQALALTVIDPDANGFVHWLAFDIPGASSGSLPENVGTGSAAPPQGKNGRGVRGYTGPCPPSGTHHYVFTLYALDARLGLGDDPSLGQLQAATRGHALGMAVLTGTFKHS